MFHGLKHGQLAWLAIGVGIGVAGGLIVAGIWPEEPL